MPTEQRRVVWVVECGVYSDMFVFGVYSTPERAMEAVGNPVPDCHKGNHRHTWESRGVPPSWDNGCDWSNYATISPVVIDASPRDDAEEIRALLAGIAEEGRDDE